MFVLGAAQISPLERIRTIIPEHFLLVPGVGAQGGSLADVVRYCKTSDTGLLVNASRAILYASSDDQFAAAAAGVAAAYRDEMSSYL